MIIISHGAKDLVYWSYYFGLLAGWATGLVLFLVFMRSAGIETENKKLLRNLKTLVAENQGIVTVADLMMKGETSLVKTQKFLKKLTRELEIEPQVDEQSGTIFYKFISSKEIISANKLQASLRI